MKNGGVREQVTVVTYNRASATLPVLRDESINVGLSSHVRGQIDGDTLARKIPRQIPDKLDLFFNCEATGDGLEDRANCHSVFADQAAIIDVGEDAHQELAIHSISHPPVSRNAVAKVLDVEGTLKPGSEEATERSNKGCKNGHNEDVEMVDCIRERRNVSSEQTR